MFVDVRISQIFKEYETEWNDSIIDILKATFPNQIKIYYNNYFDRTKDIFHKILPNITIGSKDDYIFQAYKNVGFYIFWISLLRTLDIKVTFMILQRTSIIFTQYLIVFVNSKENNLMKEFCIKDLNSYILKNILGNLRLPINSRTNQDNIYLLWSTVVEMYSTATVEYE